MSLPSIDRNTVVVDVDPLLTLQAFQNVLEAAGSPAAPDAKDCYFAVLKEGVEPAFALAIFKVESNYGADPNSIVVKFNTHNPGNTRSSTIGPMPLITTDRGVFVKFDKWARGFQDLAHRLVAKDYVYAQEGRKTIAGIIERFAPATDQNNPAGYIQTVINLMNSWIGNNEVTPVATKPNITWVGSPNHYNGRSGQSIVAIVNHIMVGTMESTRGWFNNPASEVSSTFGVAKDGRIHQYVALENGAWANGITESVDPAVDWLVKAVRDGVNPNNLTVSIEHEGNSGDIMPEAQYQATLALHRWLISRYSISVDRQHIIGHYQIMKFTKANCPGKGFPWARLMADLANGEVSHVNNQIPEKPYNPNPDNFSVGQGVLDVAKNHNLIMLTNEMYFTPNANQPGLGQTSHSWAKDSNGKVFILIAIEHPETITPDSPSRWEIKVTQEI